MLKFIVVISVICFLVIWICIDYYKRKKTWDNMKLPFRIGCLYNGGGFHYTYIIEKDNKKAYIKNYGWITKDQFIHKQIHNIMEISYEYY